MKIISLNLNGIRSAAKKGVFPWLQAQCADVICVQETRIQVGQLTPDFELAGYHRDFVFAQSKGYSGVAIYCKQQPDSWQHGIGVQRFDDEGRWIEARLGKLSVVSLYLPSGSSGEERQAFKFESLDWLSRHFAKLKKSGRDYVICGDWNIAHENIDIKNWRGNQKNSGFLPEERAWLTELFGKHGWVDAHRALKPGVSEYTWWSNRGQAYANDVGWRIDYQVLSPSLASCASAVEVVRDPRFSDHAPLIVTYRNMP